MSKINRAKHQNPWNPANHPPEGAKGQPLFDKQHLFPCFVEYENFTNIDQANSSFGYGLGAIEGLCRLKSPEGSHIFYDDFIAELCNRHFEHLVLGFDALQSAYRGFINEQATFCVIQKLQADHKEHEDPVAHFMDNFALVSIIYFESERWGKAQFVSSRQVCSVGYGDAPEDLELHELFKNGQLAASGQCLNESGHATLAGRFRVKEHVGAPSRNFQGSAPLVEEQSPPLVIYDGSCPVAICTDAVSSFLHRKHVVTNTRDILEAITSRPPSDSECDDA
tara:strand:- start:1525 stop:2364 length:840 start_codon:yes stop_codon:yes gene_type:complete